MSEHSVKGTIIKTIKNMPNDWLRLTTHRLDIYNESIAKVEFIEKFESSDFSVEQLAKLPTAFDYIRLGHPLSCVLEWAIAKTNSLKVDNVISFSSQTMPIMAVLRRNFHLKKKTRFVYQNELPVNFDKEIIQKVYGYSFELQKVESYKKLKDFDGSTLVITDYEQAWTLDLKEHIDFVVSIHPTLGSIIQVNGEDAENYVGEIQHVRRRESIAMTPQDCLSELKKFVGINEEVKPVSADHKELTKTIQSITATESEPVLGSCGLSVQYAIMMGLIDHSFKHHPNKNIKFIVPPNCYGGTNDQARRVAACVEKVEIIDLAVDRGKNMVDELEVILEHVAREDALAFIIAEIPTNPRVEVPNLIKLQDTLSKNRKTNTGENAITPVFILDQTFCPNVKFLGEGDFLYEVPTISYVSGSKFPSGGLCTAGYCVANDKAKDLIGDIQNHLNLCANNATDLQIQILTQQMPSMNERIDRAYKNTRDFVDFIQEKLPKAKINFVSEKLADAGFTPSVFSLDLPTKGESSEQKENYKRELNHKLIKMMIDQIPEDSKHCVSYGQLKGCYWTIPATSTQGTTREGDKDYIVRVSVAPELDLQKHKEVFSDFVKIEKLA